MEKNTSIENKPLKVLILEDTLQDRELMVEQLSEAGYQLDVTHTEEEAGFREALKNEKYDIILSDYMLPGFDAFGALEICQEICPEVPFICVSGSIGEELAIDLMKKGAVDYVLKDRPARLPYAVKHALEKAKGNAARLKTEIELQESEARFRQVAETAQECIWEVDTDGLYTYASPVIETLLGYTPDEVVGKKYFYDFFAPENKEDIKKAYLKFFSKKEVFRYFENVNLHKNGNLVMVSTSGSPVFDVKGNFTGYRGVDEDITERKQSEIDLLESEERYRAFIQNSSEAIWCLGMEQDLDITMSPEHQIDWLYSNAVIIECNDAMAVMHGFYDIKEVYGRRLGNILPRLAADNVTYLKDFIRNGYRISDRESRELNQQTEVRYFASSLTGIVEEGHVSRIWGVKRDITERKQAEEKLILLNRAVEASSVSVVITDAEGYISYVNPFFTELTGYSSDEVFGKKMRILNPGKLSESDSKELWSAILSEKNWIGEYQNRKKNGEFYWENAVISPILNSNGTIINFVAVKEDITEHKRDQEKIIIAKDTYESIFNSVSEAIYILDEKGIFIDVNKGAEFMYGYTHAEFIGKSPAEVSAPGMNDLNAVWNIIQRVSETGISQSFEFFGQHKNGEVFPKEVIINRGKYFGKDHIIATSRNITERKKAETAQSIQLNIARSVHSAGSIEFLLEKVKEQMGLLFDTTNFFVAIYNRKKNTLKQLIFSDNIDSFDEWNADQSLSGQVVKLGKIVFLRGDEIDAFCKQQNIEEPLGTIPACWLGVPITMHQQVCGAVVIQHYTNPKAYNESDVALLEMIAHETGLYIEKKQMVEDLITAKEKAEESDRLKSAFLANMSHEIRTPMNGILGFSELLKEPSLTGETQQKYIRIIEEAGARMLNIINNIVSISKIESGTMGIQLKEMNINNQMQFVYDIFKLDADKKKLNLSFNCKLTDKEAIIETDSEKFYGILSNLVKNAIKYTDSGTIEYRVTNKGKEFEFYVKDTGIGIPKERQEAIFERFIQADISDKMARQGAGLGLAISKAYATMLGGKMWVESEEGIGSTFYFTLPYNAEPIKETIDWQPEPLGNILDVRKLKILIAEDDEVSEMLLDETVIMFGKEILKARTGVEAVEICRDNPDIDLILMDIRMPDLGGHEATKQIRGFNKEVIIIAQTADGLMGDREKSLESGCNDYIAKPIIKDKLMTLIQKYFRK